jgi:hypothetical protein
MKNILLIIFSVMCLASCDKPCVQQYDHVKHFNILLECLGPRPLNGYTQEKLSSCEQLANQNSKIGEICKWIVL